MLLVNSFPRTANRYFMFCIEKYLDVPIFSKMPSKLHNIKLLSKKDINQIVIFRNPKDTIISFVIFKKINNARRSDLAICVDEFIEWAEEFAKNINHIYPFTFEQVTKQTFECLNYLSDTFKINKQSDKKILDLHKMLKSKNGGWNFPKNGKESSKKDIKYADVEKEYNNLSPEIIVKLYDLEIYMNRLIAKRQEKLGWALNN